MKNEMKLNIHYKQILTNKKEGKFINPKVHKIFHSQELLIKVSRTITIKTTKMEQIVIKIFLFFL